MAWFSIASSVSGSSASARVRVSGATVMPRASSSVMANVTSAGFATPPPLAVPETVTVLSGASTSLSTAVMVTVPVLTVDPAAIVSVVLALTV